VPRLKRWAPQRSPCRAAAVRRDHRGRHPGVLLRPQAHRGDGLTIERPLSTARSERLLSASLEVGRGSGCDRRPAGFTAADQPLEVGRLEAARRHREQPTLSRPSRRRPDRPRYSDGCPSLTAAKPAGLANCRSSPEATISRHSTTPCSRKRGPQIEVVFFAVRVPSLRWRRWHKCGPCALGQRPSVPLACNSIA
jgi:hypothetical protein